MVLHPRLCGAHCDDPLQVSHGIPHPSACHVTTMLGLRLRPPVPRGCSLCHLLSVVRPPWGGFVALARSKSRGSALPPSPVGIAWLCFCRLWWPFSTPPGLSKSSSRRTNPRPVFAHLLQQLHHHVQSLSIVLQLQGEERDSRTCAFIQVTEIDRAAVFKEETNSSVAIDHCARDSNH